MQAARINEREATRDCSNYSFVVRTAINGHYIGCRIADKTVELINSLPPRPYITTRPLQTTVYTQWADKSSL